MLNEKGVNNIKAVCFIYIDLLNVEIHYSPKLLECLASGKISSQKRKHFENLSENISKNVSLTS